MRVLMALLFVLPMLSGLRFANAETYSHSRTTTTTTVETDEDLPSNPPMTVPPTALPNPPPVPPPPPGYRERTMTQSFGSTATSGMSGCKTEALSKDVTKDLKRECNDWVKEQKADLGKRYEGSTCESSCDDCGMSLIRCKINGTIHYRTAADNE